MPTYQTAANVKVVIAPESTTGTAAAATVTTARVVRIIDSPGLALRRALVASAEKRDDGNAPMPRLGGKMVDGSLNTELTVGGAITPLTEAIMRAAYATSTTVAVSLAAIGTNYISQAGNNFISAGLKVGDIFTLTGTANATSEENKRTPLLAVATETITVPAGTFNAVATITGVLTRLRKLTSGATPTRKSYSVEQYEEDNDLSELFLGCRVVGLRMSMQPGQPVKCEWRLMGMDRTILATNTSPYFTNQPAVTTGLSLIVDDASVYKSGTAVAAFTGFDLDFSIAAAGQNVFGSAVPADIFDNDLTVSGTITGLRSDFANLTTYDAGTEFDLMLVLTEAVTAPKPCVALYLPRVMFKGLSAPVGGGDGPKFETVELAIGPKDAATTYDATVAVWSQSAA